MPAIVPPPTTSRPADRRPEPAAAEPASTSHGRADDADRLADDVADDDPERDRRPEGAREEVAVDRDAGVREREQRHDHVARPRVHSAAGGARSGETRRLDARRAERASSGVGCSRKSAEEVGRVLEVARARRGRRSMISPTRQPDDDRVDAGLVAARPRARRRAARRPRRARMPARRAARAMTAKSADRDQQRHERDVARCRRSRSPRSATRSSTTTTRQQERAQPLGEPSGRRARASPSANAVSVDIAAPQPCADASPGVERPGRSRPARASRRAPATHRQREAAALAQLAEVELAPRLEPDDEEEERHQPAVDPLAQVQVEARSRRGAARARVLQTRSYERDVDVRPDQRRGDRGEQDRGAAGLGVQERPQGRLEVARPGGAAGVRPRGGGLAHRPIVAEQA